jgi:hypothetical protein
MEGILRAIDAHVRTGGGFALPRRDDPRDDNVLGTITGLM